MMQRSATVESITILALNDNYSNNFIGNQVRMKSFILFAFKHYLTITLNNKSY